MARDITEDIPYDLSSTVSADTVFSPTDIAYDLAINNLPFRLTINNQNPYRRQTAQYKKDQFDSSSEPGEQSLTGWWIRSQTSWHHGAGIRYYEPASNAEAQYRFWDSRGVNPWTLGELSLLNDTFHSYTGANGIIAVAGQNSTGATDYIVSVDSAGSLKILTLNQDAAATVTNMTSTLATGHSSSNPFKSITSDGTRYFACCSLAIHVGNLDGSDITSGVKDVVIHRHNTGGIHAIEYVKGYLMFGEATTMFWINDLANPLVTTGHSTSGSTLSGLPQKAHENPFFTWTGFAEGNTHIYAFGYAGSKSEIWAIPFDVDVLLGPDVEAATVVAELPYGEIVKSMKFYLGYMLIGTNKGIRVGTVAENGQLVYGPLLYESDHAVTGFTVNDKFAWGSTTVMGDDGFLNAVLVRVDLSSAFEDGSFAYAYDMQYQSDQDSYGKGVLYADNRLHLITDEGDIDGEIQTENLSAKRTSGWIETGYIRYSTVEPKYFKYVKVNGTSSAEDGVSLTAIDSVGAEYDIATIGYGTVGQDIAINNPQGGHEVLAFKLTINNASPITNSPTITSYQVKAVPGVKRQRLYQYPLSCFNTETDRYDVQFGYSGRAYDLLTSLEALEELGDLIVVRDFRTGEQYQGLIEEVSFTNESSSDRNEAGFGGTIIITIRKM
jgi:hypothetical protein